MKALILAAGKGSRLTKLPKGESKCMIRVNGYPLLYYHLLRAIELRVDQIVIVIGHAGNIIQKYFGHSFLQVPITYVWQKQLTGPVSAINAASNCLDDDFVLMLADEYFVKSQHMQMLNVFKQAELFGLCGIIEGQAQDSIKKTYAVNYNSEGRIFKLVEKPEESFWMAKGTGLCFFRKELLLYIPFISAHKNRGQKEFPELVQRAIDCNKLVHAFLCCERFYNLNLDEDCELLSCVEKAIISMPNSEKAS